MLLDYLNKIKTDRFTFLCVPKILLQNEAFQELSAELEPLYNYPFNHIE